MDRFTGMTGLRRGSWTRRFLLSANLLLIGVTWAVSISVYGRLPLEVPSWLSLWKSGLAWTERSAVFFAYPAVQTVLFSALLGLSRALLKKDAGAASGVPPSEDEGPGRRLLELKKETVLLALIFLDLVFIHLQTSLILLARGAGSGINVYYFAALLVMIAFILGPYYRLRRRLIGPGPGGRHS